MKTFKQLDLYINILLVAGFTIWFAFNQNIWVVGYFVTGSWQVISMVTHLATGWFVQRSSDRIIYSKLSAVCIGLMLTGLVLLPLLLPILFVMLFLSPIMAIRYTFICHRELQELKQNQALSLK